MMTDREWNIISQKAFPQKAVKAPAFLWTRVLALIESEETRRAQSWWMQWRWMVRLTAMVGILVSIGAFYLFQHEVMPLDAALDGRSNQEVALQLTGSENLSVADSAGIVIGLDS
jgi:hypothetical protein